MQSRRYPEDGPVFQLHRGGRDPAVQLQAMREVLPLVERLGDALGADDVMRDPVRMLADVLRNRIGGPDDRIA